MIIYIHKTNINKDKVEKVRIDGKTVRNFEALESVLVDHIPIEHFSVNNLENIGREIEEENHEEAEEKNKEISATETSDSDSIH